MGWWISRAPQLEEDVALANIGLDQLGQARTLLAYAGQVEGDGRREDDLAYLRDEREFRNVWLVERAQTDFGVAMARLLVFAAWQRELYAALASSTDATLAGVAGKAVKEVAYHLDHAAHWVVRLGDGTDESHARMQAALDAEWPYVEELFSPGRPGPGRRRRRRRPGGAAARRPRPDRAGRRRGDADRPEVAPAVGGGRRGLHTEELGYLLAEMQHLPARTRGRRGDRGLAAAWKIAADLPDPELPVVTIADLGILRDVTEDDQGRVHVQITPTYSGCPAMETIRTDLVDGPDRAGYQHVDVEFVLAPAWTTDWMTRRGAGQARGVRHRAPGRARRGRTGAARAVGALPAVRQRRHPRVQPLRLDGVQVAVGVPQLPRAVRPLQGHLRMSATFHSLRVAAIDELTDDAVALTFEVPPDAARTTSRSRTASTSPSAAATTCAAPTRSAPRRRRAAADRRQAAARRRVQRGRASTACASATPST